MSGPNHITCEQAVARIKAAARIVVTTHARADGDAIGCVAALQRVLRQAGKTADAYLHESMTASYGFLSELEPLSIWKKEAAADVLAGADLVILVDTCSAAQLNDLVAPLRSSRTPKLAIDHHLTRDDIVDEIWADEKAGACAQMLAALFDSAGWRLDEKTATLLFTGLATDTGWFRFSNAGQREFTTAARLIKSGADPNTLYERLYYNETLPRARLIGAALSSFSLLADGKLAVIRLTREVFARCAANTSMTEDIINEPMRIGSVVACVMFSEPSDGGPIRVSLRSKRDVDVAAIAGRFGGGGHARAAGAKVEGRIESVEEAVVSAMLTALGT